MLRHRTMFAWRIFTYISLFAGFYSFAMQFYIEPRELYKAKESRAIVIFVAMIASAFIGMFVLGTTVSF